MTDTLKSTHCQSRYQNDHCTPPGPPSTNHEPYTVQSVDSTSSYPSYFYFYSCYIRMGYLLNYVTPEVGVAQHGRIALPPTPVSYYTQSDVKTLWSTPSSPMIRALLHWLLLIGDKISDNRKFGNALGMHWSLLVTRLWPFHSHYTN